MKWVSVVLVFAALASQTSCHPHDSSFPSLVPISEQDDGRHQFLTTSSQDLSPSPYSWTVDCSSDSYSFRNEEDKSNSAPGCLPQRCGGLVLDGLFSDDEVNALRALALRGMSWRGQGQSLPGPTIFDINTGYIKDTKGLINVYQYSEGRSKESNKRMFKDSDFQLYSSMMARIRTALNKEFGLEPAVNPTTAANEGYPIFTAPTFITRIKGEKSWRPSGIHDEYWHWHVDRDNTPHYAYSGLLYLADYEKDFTGGHLLFAHPRNGSYSSNYNVNFEKVATKEGPMSSEDFWVHRIEPKRGRIALFTSGKENVHRVTQVTSGERLVLSLWFTCDLNREYLPRSNQASRLTFQRRKLVSQQYEKKEEL